MIFRLSMHCFGKDMRFDGFKRIEMRSDNEFELILNEAKKVFVALKPSEI